MSKFTVVDLEIESKTMGSTIEASVILPQGYDAETSLPLLINLHGGGSDRSALRQSAPLYQEMFENGSLQPVIVVSFSSGPFSFYADQWENFIVEELPSFCQSEFNSRVDREGVVITGISMGGFGSLKVAFKYPDRVCAVAAMEPGIVPFFDYRAEPQRGNWWRSDIDPAVWGTPVDETRWQADQPANIVRAQADKIKASGLNIYLEVGDKDCLTLHDAAEFLHRVMWDHDVPHEYHLVRWADHVGLSMTRRFKEAHGFLDAALKGGLDEPTDMLLSPEQQEYLEWMTEGAFSGKPKPEFTLEGFDAAAPTLVASIFAEKKKEVDTHPEMERFYGELPPTK